MLYSLASLTDFSDSFLPPSLAHLSLPPLDAATSGWAPPQASPALLPQHGEAALYGSEADLEIGLGSLLGAGADSWLGAAAHRSASAAASCV